MNCEACPFKNQTQVPGGGSRILKEYDEDRLSSLGRKYTVHITEFDDLGQYDVVGVGMAPAREEVLEGIVFVGVSGQILRKTLAQMGITEYYLCNILLCPIISDDLVNGAVECCRDVKQEILDRKPKLIIALGDLPWSILRTNEFRDYSIKEVEGRVLPSNTGIPMLPLTHPAYYWRRPDEVFDFIECMRSGVRFLKGNYQQAGEPELEVVTSDNYKDVLNILDKYEELSVDTETTGFNAYGYKPDELMEMGLAISPEKAYIIPKYLIGEFKALLETKKCNMWNAQFDCAFLKQVGINPNIDFDGMLAHYSLDERAYSHGLKRVARIYLGCDNWEKDIDRYIPSRQKKVVSYEVIPTEVRYKYLAKDVTRTLMLKSALRDDINWKVFNTLLMPATRMFIEIEYRGMRIDPYKLLSMDEIISKDIDQLEKDIHELTGTYLNPNSVPEVKDLVFNKLKIPIDPFFGETTSKNFLDQYREGFPVIDKILDYRQLSKNKGTYLEGFAKFVDKDFRIHPKINTFKSVTGRLSSEDPSIMNIKLDSKLKSIFLPDEGSVLGYGDIKQNELRWYYIYSKDEELGAILRRISTKEEPRANDPHYIVSRVAYGEELADKLRTAAKAVVFGRMYKRGRKSIEYQVGSEVIDKLMDTVDGIFPNIENYYKDIMKKVKSKGYLESYFGRRRRFILITPENKHNVERQAINFPIQSAGSDLMLLNMLHLWELKEKLGIFPFWPVHDSITWNMPDKSLLPVIKKELESYSLELVNGMVPFEWDIAWGYNWGEMQKE